MEDTKPTVFICYSHKDEEWKDSLLPQFEQLAKLGILKVWDDRKIRAGEDWYARIQEVLNQTRFAVCLVSANFLNSSFCMAEEIPFLLRKRRALLLKQPEEGLDILPILVAPCVRQAHTWIKRLQMLPRDDQGRMQSVAVDFKDSPDVVFAEAAKQVYEALQPGYTPPPKPPPPGTPPEKTDLSRLPETGSLLFGRRDELDILDQRCEDEKTNLSISVSDTRDRHGFRMQCPGLIISATESFMFPEITARSG